MMRACTGWQEGRKRQQQRLQQLQHKSRMQLRWGKEDRRNQLTNRKHQWSQPLCVPPSGLFCPGWQLPCRQLSFLDRALPSALILNRQCLGPTILQGDRGMCPRAVPCCLVPSSITSEISRQGEMAWEGRKES